MPILIAFIARKKANITQLMLISNTIRANITHELCLKKEIIPIFDCLIGDIYNFRSETRLSTIWRVIYKNCIGQKLYRTKIVWYEQFFIVYIRRNREQQEIRKNTRSYKCVFACWKWFLEGWTANVS